MWLPNPFRKLFALGFLLSLAGGWDLWCLRLEGAGPEGSKPGSQKKACLMSFLIASTCEFQAGLSWKHPAYLLMLLSVTWRVSLLFRSNHYIAQ